MKLVKFGMIALALGLFATSCNDATTGEEVIATDTTVVTEPVVETVPATTDTVGTVETTTTTTTTVDSNMAH